MRWEELVCYRREWSRPWAGPCRLRNQHPRAPELVELVVELWYVGHRPQIHRLVHGFSGQGIRPTLERATRACELEDE